MKSTLLCLLLAASSGYQAAGQDVIDSAFGENGLLHCEINMGMIVSNNGIANHVAVQPDGRIVTAVNYNNVNSVNLYYTTTRYTANGGADTTFGGGGASHVFVGDQSDNEDVLVQPDGKIVTVGNSKYCINGVCGSRNFVMMRLNPDGTADSTFATNGILQSFAVFGQGVYSLPNRVFRLSNGKYMIGGRGLSNKGFAGRVNADGTPDATYGTNGIYTDSLSAPLVDMDMDTAGNLYGLIETYAFDPNGGPWTSNSQVVKLLPNGAVDLSFGNAGFVSFDFSPYDEPTRIRVRPDGRIVFTGIKAPSTSFEAYGDSSTGFLMMLEPSGVPVAGMPAGGLSYLLPGDSSTFINALTVLPDNRMMTGGFKQTLINGNFYQKGFIARLNADGSPDVTFNGTGALILDYGVASDIGSLCGVNCIQRLDNGELLAAGYRNPIMNNTSVAVMMLRLKSNGQPTGLTTRPAAMDSRAYPNPWRGMLTLRYALAQADVVTVALYDVTGRQAAVLLDKAARSQGAQHETLARPQGLAPGRYQLVLTTAAAQRSATTIVVGE